jgi:hypothetical protein
VSDTKYIFDAVKKNEENVPLNFQITFTEELVPVVSEMARDLVKQGWEVKTLRETLLPWDLNES